MTDTGRSQSFLKALQIARNDVACFVGAGGKTSLIFRLAEEAKLLGYKVLVTTTTRMLLPDPSQFNAIDLSGMLFSTTDVAVPGIYVAGQTVPETGKMSGGGVDKLARQLTNFDLVLIEGDGAARKPLKGWNRTEPVIPLFTTKTIGIIDIQVIGQVISNTLIHRLEVFLKLTGAKEGDIVSISHIERIISHENGIFRLVRGKKLLYINKVESDKDRCNVKSLQDRIPLQRIVAGSIHEGVVFV